MAKSKNTSVSNSEPLLFSTEQYSSRIGDIERLPFCDPAWDVVEIELDRLIPVNAKAGTFIVEKSDICLNLGIISNINELGFFVNWLNFGESSENVNFLCGVNCFNNWERDQESIDKLAIAPKPLVDKFFSLNPEFSLNKKLSIPSNWEDKGGLWDTYPQYWVNDGETCFYDGRSIKTKDQELIVSDSIKQEYLSPRWYLSYLEIETEEGKQKPKLETGLIYLHSSGKKAKVSKILKSRASGFVEVYFEGDPIVQRVASTDLSELPTEKNDQLLRENLNVGDRIFSKKENRSGEILKIGRTGFSVQWDNWVKFSVPFSELAEITLLKEDDSKCLPCLTVTPEQEQPLLPVTSSESKQPSSSKLTPQPNESLNTDIQISPSIQISEPIKDSSNVTTYTGLVSPAQEHPTPENVKGLNIQNQKCGSIASERSQLNSLNLLLLNNPEELLTTDLEQFLGDSEWLSISGKIHKSFQQRNLDHPIKENEFSLLPTPTTYPKGSGKCRPAGTNRLEQKLRPFIQKGDKLHPAVPGWLMGFPPGWVEVPLADTGEILSIQVPFIQEQDTTSKTDENVLISTVEPSHHSKQRSHLNESVTLQNSQELETTTTTTIATTKIKALTLHQPWASLIGIHKWYETRRNLTKYRGKLAIHAAVRQDMTDYQVDELSDLLVGEDIPFGCVVAIADLTDCIKMTEEFISQQSETELRCGFWEVGRYAWKLENVKILNEPIPARGMPGLWDFELPINEQSTSNKPEFKPGEYILNGRVGQITEASPGEYFAVKYGNNYTDLKCYFWGQDDELINTLAIAPQHLVDQFLGETNPTPKISPKKKVASGSIAPYLENKKLKNGTIVSYPKVQGERDKDNHLHWKWGYYYEVKVNGEWKNRSISVPSKITPQVKVMIENNVCVEEIKEFILQCKNKKEVMV